MVISKNVTYNTSEAVFIADLDLNRASNEEKLCAFGHFDEIRCTNYAFDIIT